MSPHLFPTWLWPPDCNQPLRPRPCTWPLGPPRPPTLLSLLPQPDSRLPEPIRKAGLSCPLVAAMCQWFCERPGLPASATEFYLLTQGDRDHHPFCGPGTPRGQKSWVHNSAVHRLPGKRHMSWRWGQTTWLWSIPLPEQRRAPFYPGEPTASRTHICAHRNLCTCQPTPSLQGLTSNLC